MKIGRRIYYDKTTGNKILDLGESSGDYVESTTIEHDISTFIILSERNRESFDYIELEYGQYSQDFVECNGYRVNTETKKIEFSYPDPNAPEELQPFVRPITQQLEELKIEMARSNTELFETMLMMNGGA